MKKYEIEYRDCIGMRCGVEVEAVSEKEAIKHHQQTLHNEDDYMTELLSVDEKCFIDNEYCGCDDCNDGEWKLEDGTPLSKDDQETLNYAMDSMVNVNGLTLREAMELKSKKK